MRKLHTVYMAAAGKAAGGGSNEPPVQPPMTAEQAAKIVKRQVPKLDKEGKAVIDKDGNPVLVAQDIPVADILAVKEYEDCVVIVTSRGEKLSAAK